jgi:hypothetical protein
MRKQSALIVGGLLILIGLLNLAQTLGATWASMERLWPLVVVAGGALAVRQGLTERKGESLWFGVTAVLCGGLFAYIVLFGGGWALLADWWPLTLGFAGLGWLAAWLMDRNQFGDLALGVISLVVGAALAAINLGKLSGQTVARLLTLWPWLLVIAGVALVAVSARRWRAHADRD